MAASRVVRAKGWNKGAANKGYVKAEADRLFSLYIRARDQVCQRCGGEPARLQCAHVVSRRYHATRYAIENAMALCVRCHFWQTTHPLEGEVFFKSKIGEETFEAIRQLAIAGGAPDYREITQWLRGYLTSKTSGIPPGSMSVRPPTSDSLTSSEPALTQTTSSSSTSSSEAGPKKKSQTIGGLVRQLSVVNSKNLLKKQRVRASFCGGCENGYFGKKCLTCR